MALTSTLTFNLLSVLTKSTNNLALSQDLELDVSDTLADGDAADQAEDCFLHKGRTLAASTTEDIDLVGSLENIYGDTMSPNRLKGLLIRNQNTTAGDTLRIGGDANSAPIFQDTSDQHDIEPGGIFFIWSPSAAAITLTAGTGDILQIENTSSNQITYDLMIIVATV